MLQGSNKIMFQSTNMKLSQTIKHQLPLSLSATEVRRLAFGKRRAQGIEPCYILALCCSH